MKNSMRNLATYEAGLVQAKAYRALRVFMSGQLKEHKISMMEWALLGYIYENKQGIRVTDIANHLDVELSLITNMLKDIESRGYVIKAKDPSDGRVRMIVPTETCIKKVDSIEKTLRQEMKIWLSDVRPTQLLTFMTVLDVLSKKIDVK